MLKMNQQKIKKRLMMKLNFMGHTMTQEIHLQKMMKILLKVQKKKKRKRKRKKR